MATLTVEQLMAFCKMCSNIDETSIKKYSVKGVGGKYYTATCGVNHFGYVYGAQSTSHIYTLDLAKKWASQGYAGKSSSYFLNDCKEWYNPPRKVTDCSGMIVDAFRYFNGPNSYTDRNAATFKSQGLNVGVISKIPAVEGLFVWKSGHIGVYDGKGYVYEARGAAYGVIKSPLSGNTWTHYGYIKDIVYPSLQNTGNSTDIKTTSNSLGSRNIKLTSPYMKGTDIKELQIKLKEMGFNIGDVDGIYGLKSSNAIRLFKKNNNILPNDDIVNSVIIDMLFENSSTTVVDTPVITNITYKTISKLNLRDKASTSGKILDTIPLNTIVDISEIANGWGKTTFNKKTGWCSMSYLTLTNQTIDTTVSIKYKILASSLNIRSLPSTSGKILTDVKKGTIITVTEISNGWGKTSANGKIGWCSLDSKYVQKI